MKQEKAVTVGQERQGCFIRAVREWMIYEIGNNASLKAWDASVEKSLPFHLLLLLLL